MRSFIYLVLAIGLSGILPLRAQNLDFFRKARGNRNYCQFEDELNTASIQNFNAITKKINYIVVSKTNQKTFLFSGKKLVKIYPVVFGKMPIGTKQFEGDLKTPEGLYFIAEKNPESKYYKSLQISYPTKEEVKFARSQGQLPGNEIMFHGLPNRKTHESKFDYFKRLSIIKAQSMGINWTKGCIAMTNADIDEMYSLVSINTLVEICPTH